ncbi:MULTISPECIES: colicin immunity domain-containing protein [unclassified Pseudomonas]|uniref:colicin immunity domain-containing protein n=1 Tax=unclassified Pseudomonas TaxID=196821 RepID=UPI00128D0F7F|nr:MULTISPECIES: colicin immunity domain-containing protein [unclassified Pseudomonas]MPQ71371.1 colicin immunity protein [Pseudomonas sp. MWU12-2323]
MSLELLAFAESFVAGKLSANEFCDVYIERWRVERDTDVILQDAPALSGCLSSVFCAADMYSPDSDRLEYEFDGERLRTEVVKLIEAYRRGDY